MHTKLTTSVPILVRNGMIIGALLVASIVAIDLVRYPSNFNQGTIALFYMLVLAFLLAGYTLSAIYCTRIRLDSNRAALRNRTLCGLLLAAIWVVEITAGNILNTQLVWVKLAYYGAILCVPIVTVIAGAWAAAHAGGAMAGILMGLWSGLVSGLIVSISILLLTFVPLSAQNIDPRELAAFQRSGLPDLATYEAGENLAAAINHLLIGPVVGVVFGFLGGLAGSALAPRAMNR